LLQTEIAIATRRRPEDLTAYDFYLRAIPQFYLATREGFAAAIRLAHRALELDPRFGLAAALAGVCHSNNVTLGYAADPQFDRKEAVRLLRLALSIDDGDPDTLAWAAFISAYIVGLKAQSKWLTERSRSTQIHFSHGTAEAGSIKLRGCGRKRSGALNVPFA
jgi:adenylate cyclase